jgi:phenylalanyl-tRNA synthetase beta subunit
VIESANWNFINLRKTLSKTASTVKPLTASAATSILRGRDRVSLCLKRVQEWGGGEVVQGVLDEYGKPYEDTVNRFSAENIAEVLGQAISLEESTQILESWDLLVGWKHELWQRPATRTDFETGIIGRET